MPLPLVMMCPAAETWLESTRGEESAWPLEAWRPQHFAIAQFVGRIEYRANIVSMKHNKIQYDSRINGGGSGIRTHGGLAPTPVFKTKTYASGFSRVLSVARVSF
jgi:hypothetical protein